MPRILPGNVTLPITGTPQALIRAGRHELAIAEHESRVQANPDDHAAWHQLALAHSQQRNFFGAHRAIKMP